MNGPLISPEELLPLLARPGLKLFDATWVMPSDPRDIEASFRAARLPGAQRFDIDAMSDPESDLPHMLSTPARMQSQLRALGVEQGSRVVVYDQLGLFSAPRAWWMLRQFGLEKVQVLDGGLPGWIASGGNTVSGPPDPAGQGDARARPCWRMVLGIRDVAELLGQGLCLLDARSAERFSGEAAEPRPGLRSGHIEGSACLPWQDVLTESGRLRQVPDLRQRFAEAGHRPGQRFGVTCGTGVTACILALAAEHAGLGRAEVYDGAWTEWAQAFPDASSERAFLLAHAGPTGPKETTI